MQKNVPKYTPEWVPTVPMWAETSKREVVLRAVQRPPHAAVVRQPAGRRVPPDAGPRRPTATARPTSCSTSTRPTATRSRWRSGPPQLVRQALADAGLAGAVKTSGAKGVHVFVPIDEQATDRGRRRRDPGHRGSGRAPRPGAGHHGVHQGGPRRQGVPRLDPGGRRDGGGRVQPAGPARASRCRSRSRWDDLDASRRPTSPCTRRRDCSATATRGPTRCPAPQHLRRRPRRGGPRDPHRPGAGDARGQAAGPGPPQLNESRAGKSERDRLSR